MDFGDLNYSENALQVPTEHASHFPPHLLTKENHKEVFFTPDTLAFELQSASQKVESQHLSDSLDNGEGNHFDQNLSPEFEEEHNHNVQEETVNNSLRSSPSQISPQDSQQQIETLQIQLLQFKKESQDMAARIEELETEKELAEEEKLAIEEEKLTSDLKLEQLEGQLGEFQLQIKKQHKETEYKMEVSNGKIFQLKDKVKELKNQTTTFQEERDFFQEENNELKKQLEQFKNKFGDLEGKNIKLKHKVERLEVINSKLESELIDTKEKAEKQIGGLEDEVGQLGEQLAMARAQGQEWIEEYQSEQKRIEPRLKDLGEIVRNLEKQRRWLENQRNEHSSRRDELTLEREKLSAQVDDLSNTLNSKNKELSSLNDRYELKKNELAQQRTEMAEAIRQIKEINEELREDIETVTNERNNLEKQMEATEVEANNLLKKAEELEEYKDDLIVYIDQLNSEVRNLETQRTSLSDPDDTNIIPSYEKIVVNTKINPDDDILEDKGLLRDEIARLQIENNKLNHDKHQLDDEKSRLEIRLTEMPDPSSAEIVQPRNSEAINLRLEEEKLLHLESEIVALRIERASLTSRLASQESQISLIDNLRLALDHAKKQVLLRENEVIELKSKLELNQLNMKSKLILIEQLQEENNDTLPETSKNSSRSHIIVNEYELLLDELNAKLDVAYNEIGKLKYQITEAALKIQDDIKDARIQDLDYQKSELEKVLKMREEELIKEQNKSRSLFYTIRTGRSTRGGIIEGISGLLGNALTLRMENASNISFSRELPRMTNAEVSFHGSIPARNNAKMRSLKPCLQSLKSQIGNLNQRLEAKNIDLEQAIAVARGLSSALEETCQKIRSIEELMEDTEKSMNIIQEEFNRREEYIRELENYKCGQCGGKKEMNMMSTTTSTITGAKSNHSMTVEKEIEATLNQNMQTAQYLDQLVRVVSQQNNFLRANQDCNDLVTLPIKGSQHMKNVQNLLEGLSQQASQMQRMMVDSGNVLKRLASKALTDSPSKKQKRQNTRLSHIARNSSKPTDDTLVISREDLQAIVLAGNDMFKHPAQFLSSIENLAFNVMDEEARSTESKEIIHLFEQITPNLQNTAKKIEILTGSLQKALREFKSNSEAVKENYAYQTDRLGALITGVHELTANNMHLAMQMKQLAGLITASGDEEKVFSKPVRNSEIISQEVDSHQKDLEKLRKLVATQSQIIFDYEATIELFKRSEIDIQSLRAALNTIINPIDVDKREADPNGLGALQSQLQEVHTLWQQEVEANTSLRIVMKEMKVTASSKEQELRTEVETLTLQIQNLSAKMQSFKLCGEKFEKKYKEGNEVLKKRIESEGKLRCEHEAMIDQNARDIDALKLHWEKERAILTESITKAKAQQLAIIDANQKETEDTWKQEKEGLNKKLKLQKESYEKDINSYRKEIEKSIAKIKDLEIEIQSAMASKKLLTLEKASLAKDKTQLQQQLDNFHKESERYRKKNSSIVELETRCRRLQKEKDVNSERATQKIADLQKELQDTIDKLTKLTKEKITLNKEKTELNRRYMMVDEMKENLEREVRQHQEHMKALEVEIQNLTEQLQSERRDHQDKKDQLSRYEDELQVVQEECNRHREELEQLQDTLAHERNEHQIEISRLESIISQRKGALDGEEIKQLNRELSLANNRIKETQEAARTEINALEEEIQITKQQLVMIEKTHLNGSGVWSLDLNLADCNIGPQDDFKSELVRYQKKLKSELNRERKRHADELTLLAKEVQYQKAKFSRESGLRADLSYQKKFILLLLGGFESCETAASMIHSSLYNFTTLTQASRSLAKFRSAVTAVIAIQRMRILKNSWAQSRELKRFIQRQKQQ
ncbi:hypothetical protein G9A89_019547 [Geosiphon pyriformis]|nr:hypothetical protein G9A89_019547 [Geosiphon pyriformis]